MPDDGDRPATKADLALLDQKIDASVGRLAKEILKTNDRMDSMEERLTLEMRRLNADVTGKMDVFIDRMETIWRESAVLPRVVDEHAETLRDHEGRIKALESGQS